MRLEYKTQLLADAECLITYNGGQRVYGPRGIATSFVQTWIIEGEIVAANQAAVEVRRKQIDVIFSSEGGLGDTARLLADDGTPTYILSGNKGGIKVLEFAWLQEEAKAHFATGLPFRVRLAGESFISDNDNLLAYEETVTRIGNGGPREVYVELQNGPPVRQITATHTPITIIQRGSAVSERWVTNDDYQAFNTPLFPDNLINPEEATERIAPSLDGLSYVHPTVRWNYIFVFNTAEQLPFPILR
jgi:hypothetical protein